MNGTGFRYLPGQLQPLASCIRAFDDAAGKTGGQTVRHVYLSP